MKKYFYIAIVLFLSLTLVSCEEIVELDLNSVEPKLVIDASISDSLPCTVLLTKTQDFYNNDPSQTVSKATVILTDGQGVEHILTESEPGKYQSNVVGEINKTYKLHVQVEGKSYNAVGTIPERVPIDSMYIFNLRIGDTDSYSPAIIFDDPAGVENFYYSTLYVNDRKVTLPYITSDEFRDGVKGFQEILFYRSSENGDIEIKIGDKINVTTQMIDKGAYTFFMTWLELNAGGAGNPTSNFSGGALGCFKAYTESKKEIIVREDHIFTR